MVSTVSSSPQKSAQNSSCTFSRSSSYNSYTPSEASLSMRSFTRCGSLPESSKSSRSRLEEMRISIDGDIVLKNSRRLS